MNMTFLAMMNMASIIDAFLGVFHSEQLDECFWWALRDVTTEEGYYVLESFCQNVKVVSGCLYNIIQYTYIYIYIYIYHEQETSVCMYCIVKIKQKIQRLFDKFLYYFNT